MEAENAKPDAPAKPDLAQKKALEFEVNTDRAGRANDQANFLHERVEDVVSIVVMGDVVGRDKVIGPKPSKAVHPMSTRTLERYKRFAAPARMDEVRALLATEKVVVLAAQRGWGKYALGVNLLDELTGEPNVVAPETDLRAVVREFEAEKGYVIADVPLQQLLELSRDDVDALVNAVELRSSMFVITVRAEDVSLLTNFLDLAPDLGEPAPLAAVLRAHLRASAKPDRLKELLADKRVLDRLGTCDSRGEVCDLALELTGSTRSSTLNSLSTQEKRQLRAEVEGWLRDLGDARWPYAFAAAVLDGMPADVAVRGGAELSRSCRLEALDADSRIQLLTSIKTRSALEYWYTRYGEVPVQVVRCEQQRHRPLVVELAWRHGAQLRGPMLRWLRRMGEHDDPHVAIAVGAAVGQLALHDFSAFTHDVIEYWAAADEIGPREAAVAALSIIASDKRFMKSLLKLVARWGLGSPAEEWTAVRAFGRPLGAHSMETTLRRFRVACWKLDSSIVAAVADSTVELVIDGTTAQLAVLLDAIVEWSGDEREALRTAAVFVFLRMCVDVMDTTSFLPRLLCPGDDKAIDAVATLWVRAIVHPDLHETAEKTARLWAKLCETHSRGPELLAELFGRVGRWPRERRLVQAMASSWINPKRPPLTPRCAQAVTRAVEQTAERDAV